MNWKLILLLSIAGPLLAVLGIYANISFNSEQIITLVLFLVIAFVIGLLSKSKFFLNGMVAVLLAGFLMTVVRLKLLSLYFQYHPETMDQAELIFHKISFIRSPLLIISILLLTISILAGFVSLAIGSFANRNRL